MVVEDGQHTRRLRLGKEALHVREGGRVQVIARAVLACAPVCVDGQHVQREAVLAIVLDHGKVFFVRPVLIAAVPRAEGLDVRDRRTPGERDDVAAQLHRRGIGEEQVHVLVLVVGEQLPTAVVVGRAGVCRALRRRDHARRIRQRKHGGRVARVGELGVEPVDRHGVVVIIGIFPHELAVTIGHLDRIGCQRGAVFVELDRVVCGLCQIIAAG